MASLRGILIAFVLLSLVFYAVERLFPAIRGQRRLRRGFTLDLLYWLFTPLVTKALAKGAVIAGVVLIALLLGHELGPGLGEELTRGFGPVARQPLWAVALEMLVLGDLVGYWTHRAFHGKRLWKFHAVHHSSTELDWLSSVRLHPVNDVLSRLAQVAVLMLAGFPLTALAVYIPFLTLNAIFLHANVSWDYGPLRYVISSPRFHRWHHTSQAEGQDRNFAGLLPLWDLLFGTFYMPEGRQPERFGIAGEPVPETLWGQLAYPFRRTAEQGAAE